MAPWLSIIVMGIHFILGNNYCDCSNSGVSREWIFVSAEKEYYLDPAAKWAAVPVLLCNKPPQTQWHKVATIYYAQEYVAQKVRRRAAGTACLCFVMPRSSSRRPKGQSSSVNRDWIVSFLSSLVSGLEGSKVGLSWNFQLIVCPSSLRILPAWLSQDIWISLMAQASRVSIPANAAFCTQSHFCLTLWLKQSHTCPGPPVEKILAIF